MANSDINSSSNSTDNTSPNIDINTPYVPRRPAPVVSISINHPIATVFRKIKNFLTHKQTLFSTTFSIKITPIVAIVSLFGLAALFGGGVTTAFNFGKTVEQKFLTSLPTPTPKVIVTKSNISTVSRAGIIQATYQLPPESLTAVPTIVKNNETASISGVTILTIKPTSTPTPFALHYILTGKSGSIVFLSPSSNVRFQNYLGLRVLITGSLDSSKNTLTVTKADDIEVLQ